MPTRFNTGTQMEPVNPTLLPVNQNPSGQPENNDLVTGQVLGSVIDQLADNSGQKDAALAQFSVAAMDVVDQTAQYRKERERILATIATADPNDKEGVGKYWDELRRLKRGQVQGALTPADANLRINNLTKQYINAYPGQTQKLLQLKNGIVQDIPSVSGGSDIDPDTEATNELVKSARLNGWGVEEQVAYNHATAVAKAQQMTLDAKLRSGAASEEDVASVVYTQVGQLFSKFAGDMGNAVTRPDFSGVKWLPELLIARGQIEQKTRESLVNTQVQQKFKFSPGFVDNTIKTALQPIDQLIDIAKQVDNPKQKAETAKQLLEIQRSGDMLQLRKLLGPMAMLANSTQDIMMYLNDISRYREQIHHGQRAELDALAKEGDAKAALLLGVIDGKDFETNLAAAVRATAEGKEIPASATPEEHKMKAQVSINAALNPRTPKEESEKMLTTLAGQPDAFEAWDARNDVKDRTKLFKSTQDALRVNARKQQTSLTRNLNPQDFKNVQFDALDYDSPFSITSPVLAAPTGTGGVPGGLLGDRLSYINPKMTTLVDALNQQYRVLSSFTPRPEMQKWAATTIEELQMYSDSSVQPQPTKEVPAPATEASAPVEATVTKSGDVRFGRFEVARTTYAIRDTKTNREMSPPALERLRTQLNGTPEGEDLEAAIDFSYSTEESDNASGN